LLRIIDVELHISVVIVLRGPDQAMQSNLDTGG